MSFKTIYILALRYRAGATAGLAEMEVVMLESARFHTNSQWEKLEQCYLLYRAASSKLGVLSLEKRLTRWRQRPKSHSLEHGVYDFWKANMRYMANYLDEDFVRRSKQLAIKASPKYVSRHVLFRYSIAATLRWTQMLPEWTSKIEDFDLIWVRWCLVFGIQNACFEEVYKELDIHPRPTFGDFWECWTVQFQAKTLKQLRPNSTLSKYTVYLFPKHLWKLVPKRVWFGNIVWKFASKRFGYKYIYIFCYSTFWNSCIPCPIYVILRFEEKTLKLCFSWTRLTSQWFGLGRSFGNRHPNYPYTLYVLFLLSKLDIHPCPTY